MLETSEACCNRGTIDQMGIDKVGIDKVGIDKVGITPWEQQTI